MTAAIEVVERYLDALNAQDWRGLARCLTDGEFERIGPFVDVYTDKTAYVEFLESIVPTLADYRVEVRRWVPSRDGDVVLVEITESFVMDGTPFAFPEALVFDVGADGLISRVQVYMMRPPDNSG